MVCGSIAKEGPLKCGGVPGSSSPATRGMAGAAGLVVRSKWIGSDRMGSDSWRKSPKPPA